MSIQPEDLPDELKEEFGIEAIDNTEANKEAAKQLSILNKEIAEHQLDAVVSKQPINYRWIVKRWIIEEYEVLAPTKEAASLDVESPYIVTVTKEKISKA